MTEKKNNIPGTLYVSNSGSAGPGDEPASLVENDLIAQNLLILAYEKPLSITELAEEYREYLKGNILEIPRHLKGILTCHRYLPAANYLVMSVVREAYEKGLHLADVDYCCPPAVLVYEE